MYILLGNKNLYYQSPQTCQKSQNVNNAGNSSPVFCSYFLLLFLNFVAGFKKNLSIFKHLDYAYYYTG